MSSRGTSVSRELPNRRTSSLTSSLRETLFSPERDEYAHLVIYLFIVRAIWCTKVHFAGWRIFRFLAAKFFTIWTLVLTGEPHWRLASSISGGDVHFFFSFSKFIHSLDMFESVIQSELSNRTTLSFYRSILLLLYRERWVFIYLLRLTAKMLCSAAFLSALHTSSLRAAQSYWEVCTAILLSNNMIVID